MYEKEFMEYYRALEARDNSVSSETNNVKEKHTKPIKNSYKHRKASYNHSDNSLKPSAVGRLIAALLVFLVFMSVFQVLTTPGRELPSFKTLKNFFDITEKVVITNTSFADDLEDWVEGVLNSFDWLIQFLDGLGLPADQTIAVISRGLSYILIPYQFVYFLFTNLWNLVVYAFTLLSWFTSGGIV